ncbi:MAG: antitoxin family protein [Pyrinomonadaceae bacterium]|jgi:predicted DNA-binding antitoxin AbrB/MazE fold protein|nr:antitoxin family protein [Pyrinomonadaceae bacterium]
MNAVEAIYENGVFRPIGKIDLNEGVKVEITVKPFKEKDSAETIPDLAIDLGISDFAENIDHYLYGLPKQSK